MARERTRHKRIAAEVQRLLNELLLTQVKDPRLSDVRINDVEVSGDLGVATIYFGSLDVDAPPGGALAAFDKANGYFRTQVAQALGIRRAPELKFVYDTSAREAMRLDRLIKQSNPDGNDPPSDDPSTNVSSSDVSPRDDSPRDDSPSDDSPSGNRSGG